VSDTTAALAGSLNAHGLEATYYFQYGPTTAYGAQTPTTTAAAATTGVKVSQALSGLALGTTYHYRLVAVSSAGMSNGNDRTFTTSRIPLKFVLASSRIVDTYGSPFSIEGTLSGTGAANHQLILQRNPFPYLGSFDDVGGPVSTNAAGSFSIRLTGLAQTTQIRLRTLDAPPVYSQAVTVRVAALVMLRAHATKTPGNVRFEGTVKPAEVGAQVVLQLMRPGRGPGGVGSTVTTRAGTSLSRFKATLLIRHSGLYRALVKLSNGRQISGYSRATTVHSTAPAHTHPRTRRRR
jgi:hypothetical protein